MLQSLILFAEEAGHAAEEEHNPILPEWVEIGLALVVWEALCSGADSNLPAPSRIWTDAKELILDPFFVVKPQARLMVRLLR